MTAIIEQNHTRIDQTEISLLQDAVPANIRKLADHYPEIVVVEEMLGTVFIGNTSLWSILNDNAKSILPPTQDIPLCRENEEFRVDPISGGMCCEQRPNGLKMCTTVEEILGNNQLQNSKNGQSRDAVSSEETGSFEGSSVDPNNFNLDGNDGEGIIPNLGAAVEDYKAKNVEGPLDKILREIRSLIDPIIDFLNKIFSPETQNSGSLPSPFFEDTIEVTNNQTSVSTNQEENIVRSPHEPSRHNNTWIIIFIAFGVIGIIGAITSVIKSIRNVNSE